MSKQSPWPCEVAGCHVEASGEVETSADHYTHDRLRVDTRLASCRPRFRCDDAQHERWRGPNARRRLRHRAASSPLSSTAGRGEPCTGCLCGCGSRAQESPGGRQTELVARARVPPRLRARAARGAAGAGGDDLRRRVMLRCVAAAAAWWTAGTAGLGFKSRRRAPRVDPMRRAGTGVAASHRRASRVDRRGRELGRGSRVGARGRWSRPQKAWRVPHATLSGRDEHVVPCRASRWRRGAAAARMLDRQALAPHRRLSRRPRGPGSGRIAR